MAATTRAPAARRRFGLWSVLILIGGALLAGLYTWLALTWDYSDGERVGLLQKFSNKGWVCKTYEGELALYVVAGVQPEIWDFSVRDPAVARQLSAAVGHRVQLHYTEHRGVPTRCFGDTGYFVDRINTIGDAPTVLTPAGGG
jgi:hypothetical protein